MYRAKSIIAIIPARGGSKGLPGKNIRALCGKPLIAWTIERALECRYLDEVMVTTDCGEIARIARRFGAEVPFSRPAALAGDEARSVDVMLHCLEHYREVLGRSFDYTLLLEPTSPLREPGDLDAMIEKLIDADGAYDTIITLGAYAAHPALAKRLNEGEVEAYFGDTHIADRRQDLAQAYFPYGVGYMSDTALLGAQQTIYAGRIMAHVIRRHQCLEIDDIYDFLAAEAVMKHQRSGA